MDGAGILVNPNAYPYVAKNGGRRWFVGGFFADHLAKLVLGAVDFGKSQSCPRFAICLDPDNLSVSRTTCLDPGQLEPLRLGFGRVCLTPLRCV